MRVLFVGTADFAVPVLHAVAASDHAVVAVVTQPDRPAGRRRLLRPGPIKHIATELDLRVLQPCRIGADSCLDTLTALDADAFLVVAYGQVLPRSALDVPRLGCFNVHASLLPALRGAAPINWAIIRGLDETGVTVIRMDAGIDTGDIVAQTAAEIGPRDTAGELAERLSRLGARLALETLPLIETGRGPFRRQDEVLASAAPKLGKADGVIDWTKSAAAIDRLVRGVTPWPGATTILQRAAAPESAVSLAIHRARPARSRGVPGTVIGVGGDGLVVATGQGALALEEVQPAGKRRMPVADFVNGYRVAAGDRFITAGDIEA